METAQQIVVHARAAARLTADSHAAQLQAARRCPSDACTVLFIHVPKTGKAG